MKPEVLAYCAGVIDSDGYIGVKRSTYAMRVVGDSKNPTYSERVCVKQVEPEAIDVLHNLFKGRRTITRSQLQRGRDLHFWEVTDLRAAAFLQAIMPYLRIKKRQAQNCAALRIVKERSKKERVARGRGHEGGSPRRPETSAEMEACYVRAKELNRVGT